MFTSHRDINRGPFVEPGHPGAKLTLLVSGMGMSLFLGFHFALPATNNQFVCT